MQYIIGNGETRLPRLIGNISYVVCVIYNSLGYYFFLEKHGLGFAIYSRVCMEIRVFCL